MINAIEARKVAESNNTRKNALRKVVENAMMVVDPHIRRVAEAGCYRAVIDRNEIMKNVSGYSFSKKEIIDAVTEELKGYGFKAEPTASYTSIHVEW